ncbi:hypothetical protein D3C81_2291560 [compost metagenome]
MSVAPVPHFFVQTQIFIPHIETADVSNFPVNNTQLSVIAVVDPEVDQPEDGREKDLHLSAMGDQILEERTVG